MALFHAYNQIGDYSNKTFTTSISLAAVGDVLIHNSLYEDAKTKVGYDFDPMFRLVKPLLSSADITFANQETILGGKELGLSSYPQFNAPQQVGDALVNAGVDIVSMANNHALDRGERGILKATTYLNKIGLAYTGAYRDKNDLQTARIFQRNGIDTAFLAYTYGTNGLRFRIPEGKDYLVQYIDNGDKIVEDIKKLRSKVDFIVVSLHFGLEDHRMPNQEQIDLVHRLSEAGADIILGSHPHVLQPVEWIKRPDGSKTFVIYSLGNFISGQITAYERIGGILELNLIKHVDKNGQATCEIKNASLLPTYTSRKGFRDYQVVPLMEAGQFGVKDVDSLFNDTEKLMKSFTDDISIISNK